MTDTMELLPCPLGCTEGLQFTAATDVTDGFVHGYSIFCPGCGISVSSEYKDEVTDQWNNRPATVPKSVADGLAEALDATQARMNATLAAFDKYNAKNGTFIGGPSLFRMGRQIAANDAILTEYRKATQ